MSKDNTVDDIASRAMHAYIKENYEESISLFTKALLDEPANKVSLASRGSAFLRLNQLENAASDFSQVIDLHPDYARAYHLRGLVRVRQGNDQGALNDFNRAIDLDAGYGAAYASRAMVHQTLGHDNKADDDMAMVASLAQVNLETAANENNIWQTHHMRVEDYLETELER